MVAAMLELPSGTVISTVELIDRTFGRGKWNFDIEQLSRLAINLPPAARKAGMRIGSPYKEPVVIGLPFVFPMIIRHRKSRKASAGQ